MAPAGVLTRVGTLAATAQTFNLQRGQVPVSVELLIDGYLFEWWTRADLVIFEGN